MPPSRPENTGGLQARQHRWHDMGHVPTVSIPVLLLFSVDLEIPGESAMHTFCEYIRHIKAKTKLKLHCVCCCVPLGVIVY